MTTARANPGDETVDLTDAGGTPSARSSVPSPGATTSRTPPEPAAEPMMDSYEPDFRLRAITPARDRRLLAMSLLVLVGLVVAGVGVGVVFAKDKDRADLLERILGIVFGPLVTLLGTSFAWYYASAPRQDEVHLPDREG